MHQPGQERPRSTEKSLFRFCPYCGTDMARFLDAGTERRRCPACKYIQYRNPVVGAAVALFETDLVKQFGVEMVCAGLLDQNWEPSDRSRRILLARRAMSYRGSWCFPCGFVEFDEEIREAAAREIEEETGVLIRVGDILTAHSNFHLPDQQSVGIWFRAKPIGGCLRPGDDVDGLGFFDPGAVDVPLAFPTDGLVLRQIAREADSRD